MDVQKLRWLSLRDEQRGDDNYRCSLFVSNLTDGSASLVLFSYQLVPDVVSSYDQGTDINPKYPAKEPFDTDKESDLFRADKRLFSYTSGTLSSALEWIETNDFVTDMFMLAELVRALDE